MGHKGKRAFDEIRELVLDKGFEKRPEQDLGKHRVFRLFKSKNKLLSHLVISKPRALPETFFHAKRVQQDEPRDTHGAYRPKHSPYDLRPGKCENERERKFGRRFTVKRDLHLQMGRIEPHDLALADAAAGHTDAKFIADCSAVHFEHMLQTPAFQTHEIRLVQEVVLKKKDKVQGYLLWRLLKKILNGSTGSP